jgi:hypothetical protein
VAPSLVERGAEPSVAVSTRQPESVPCLVGVRGEGSTGVDTSRVWS